MREATGRTEATLSNPKQSETVALPLPFARAASRVVYAYGSNASWAPGLEWPDGDSGRGRFAGRRIKDRLERDGLAQLRRTVRGECDGQRAQPRIAVDRHRTIGANGADEVAHHRAREVVAPLHEPRARVRVHDERLIEHVDRDRRAIADDVHRHAAPRRIRRRPRPAAVDARECAAREVDADDPGVLRREAVEPVAGLGI